MSTTRTNASDLDVSVKHINVGLITAILVISGFFCMLSETVLNMALASIMEQFSVTAITAQWLSTGYMLIMAVLIPVSAFFIQTIRTKLLYELAMIFYILGTLICGFAPSFPLLFAGRIVQAIGTGMLVPNIINTLLVINPVERRGKALGFFNLVMFFAPAIGPVLSGIVVQSLGWRWLFLGFLPFSSLVLIFGAIFLADVTQLTKPRLDILSVMLSTIGFAGLLYGVSNIGGTNIALMVIPLFCGIFGLIVFSVRQLKLKEPMLDVRAFRYPMFTIGILLIIITQMVYFSSMLILPLFMEVAMGLSAMTAGIIMLPGGLINGVISPVVGVLYDKYGPRVLIFPGFILSTVVFFIFSQALSATIAIPIVILLHCLGLVAAGLIGTPTQTHSFNQLPPELYPHGTAISNTLQQIGGAFGTALMIAVMSAAQAGYFSAAGNSNAATQALGLMVGVKTSMLVSVAILIGGVILSFFFKHNHVQKPAQNRADGQ
ncbi:MAG: transporter [Firmicutes bacterium]|nr:transporter [Bacillota bacterium]